MSQFKTIIQVPVESIIAKLPPGSFVHPEYGFKWDREARQLTVIWENDDFKTGLTIPVEFPESALDSKKLPDGVRKTPAPEPQPERVQNETVAAKTKSKAQVAK